MSLYVDNPACTRSCVSAVEPGGIVATHAERNSPCGALARLYVTKSVPEESVATVGHPTSTSGAPTTPLRATTEFESTPAGSISYQRMAASGYTPVRVSGWRFLNTACAVKI